MINLLRCVLYLLILVDRVLKKIMAGMVVSRFSVVVKSVLVIFGVIMVRLVFCFVVMVWKVFMMF